MNIIAELREHIRVIEEQAAALSEVLADAGSLPPLAQIQAKIGLEAIREELARVGDVLLASASPRAAQGVQELVGGLVSVASDEALESLEG